MAYQYDVETEKPSRAVTKETNAVDYYYDDEDDTDRHVTYPLEMTSGGTEEQQKLRAKAMEAPAFWGLAMDPDDCEVDFLWTDGPCHRAGMKPGDVITNINGEVIKKQKQISAQIKKSKASHPVNIEVQRAVEGSAKKEKQTVQLQIVPLVSDPVFADLGEYNPSTDAGRRGLYYDCSTHEKFPEQQRKATHFDVWIRAAKGLKNMDMVGKSDPFVIMKINQEVMFETATIDDDLNPQWNADQGKTTGVPLPGVKEGFIYSSTLKNIQLATKAEKDAKAKATEKKQKKNLGEAINYSIDFEVWDEDPVGKDPLGRVSIPAANIITRDARVVGAHRYKLLPMKPDGSLDKEAMKDPKLSDCGSIIIDIQPRSPTKYKGKAQKKKKSASDAKKTGKNEVETPPESTNAAAGSYDKKSQRYIDRERYILYTWANGSEHPDELGDTNTLWPPLESKHGQSRSLVVTETAPLKRHKEVTMSKYDEHLYDSATRERGMVILEDIDSTHPSVVRNRNAPAAVSLPPSNYADTTATTYNTRDVNLSANAPAAGTTYNPPMFSGPTTSTTTTSYAPTTGTTQYAYATHETAPVTGDVKPYYIKKVNDLYAIHKPAYVGTGDAEKLVNGWPAGTEEKFYEKLERKYNNRDPSLSANPSFATYTPGELQPSNTAIFKSMSPLKQQYVNKVKDLYAVHKPERANVSSAENVVQSWPEGQEESYYQSLLQKYTGGNSTADAHVNRNAEYISQPTAAVQAEPPQFQPFNMVSQPAEPSQPQPLPPVVYEPQNAVPNADALLYQPRNHNNNDISFVEPQPLPPLPDLTQVPKPPTPAVSLYSEENSPRQAALFTDSLNIDRLEHAEQSDRAACVATRNSEMYDMYTAFQQKAREIDRRTPGASSHLRKENPLMMLPEDPPIPPYPRIVVPETMPVHRPVARSIQVGAQPPPQQSHPLTPSTSLLVSVGSGLERTNTASLGNSPQYDPFVAPKRAPGAALSPNRSYQPTAETLPFNASLRPLAPTMTHSENYGHASARSSATPLHQPHQPSQPTQYVQYVDAHQQHASLNQQMSVPRGQQHVQLVLQSPSRNANVHYTEDAGQLHSSTQSYGSPNRNVQYVEASHSYGSPDRNVNGQYLTASPTRNVSVPRDQQQQFVVQSQPPLVVKYVDASEQPQILHPTTSQLSQPRASPSYALKAHDIQKAHQGGGHFYSVFNQLNNGW